MNSPLSSIKVSKWSSSLFRRYVGTFAMFAALLFLQLAVVVDAGAVLGKKRAEKDNPQGRSIAISNMSGRKCDMFWVNTFTRPEKFVPQFVEDGVSVGISYGADKSISSFIGHEFELRELPSKRTKRCVFDECRKVRIKVSDRYDQKVTLERDFSVRIKDDHERPYAKADDMFTHCQKKINKDELSPSEFINTVTKCMEDEMGQKLIKDQEERSFQSKIHRDMASDLVQFTCGNVNETQSREVQNLTWYDSNKNTNYNVRKLHELATSTILVVDDFVIKDHCDALKIYRNDDDDNDGDKIVPLSAAFEGTKHSRLLKSLSNKIYKLVMDRMGWDYIDTDGKTLFKYMKDEIGFDTPTHLCDGVEEVATAIAAIESGELQPCKIPGGDPVIVPTRRILTEDKDTENHDDLRKGNGERRKQQLADVFLFCEEPEKKVLGGLHFPYARIHITPKPGKLVIAVNRNSADDEKNELDDYVNEFHLCPNHEVYVHTIFKSSANGGVAFGKDEL